MSVSKPRDDGLLRRALKNYARLLKERPVLTKACTSASAGALGSIVSQILTMKGQPYSSINWKNVGAYALAGFLWVGPSVHHFHAWLERTFPKSAENSAIKKLMTDRIFFCPTFLFVYIYMLSIFEGLGSEVAYEKLKLGFWPALLINWKAWTPLQYINVKYIPQQYRLPFMSIMGFLWTVYIALKTK